MFGTVCLLWIFSLAFLFLRPRRGVSRLLFYSHAQFLLRDISISFQGGFFCLLFFSYAHAVGFLSYFSTPTPSFLSGTYRLASGGWVFLLGFHSLRPHYGFPRLLFYSHAQFSFRNISISFRGGFFCLLFFSYAHAVGFPAYFPTFTPSFLSTTYQLASEVGFSTCFSSPTPTLWVATLTFLLPRPVSALGLYD